MRDITRGSRRSTEGKAVRARVIRWAALSVVAFLTAGPALAEWKVDFSRRTKEIREDDLRAAGEVHARVPASVSSGGEIRGEPVSTVDVEPTNGKKGIFDVLFDTGEPVQEIVILNTERGFMPSQVRVRKNGRYKVHVVNVNEKEKNISFILDGFSEHHATYYGKVKTFILEPKKEGVYSFQSPETAAQGRLVVFNPQMSIRNPASEGSQ